MAIKDRDISRAMDIVYTEIENMEDTLEKLLDSKQELESENDSLRDRVTVLEQEVKSLEEALAEAYLTDEAKDEIILNSGYPRQAGPTDKTVEHPDDSSQS